MDTGRNQPANTSSVPGEWVDPKASFVAQANVADPSIYEQFATNWPACWREAGNRLDWDDPYDAVLDDSDGFCWFSGGTLNASYNCLDRHLEAGRKNQAALTWEGELGETETYTYQALYREVNAFAAALRDLGVEDDDVVTLYMPMIPQLPIAMLACARLGAPHSVVFAGFSADALATRMAESGSELVVTCDGYYQRGNAIDLKSTADNACLSVPQEVSQVVVNRLGNEGHRGHHWHYDQLIATHEGQTVDPVPRDATDLLFYIYTSGTTGEPKEVKHTTGGYLAHVAWTAQTVLDLEPTDTHFCAADIGWITGHSYIVYGPLATGATTVLYEGTPNQADKDRLWKIIERNAVDVFYTASTSIRTFVKWGEEHPAKYDLSSLRLLGTVGERIDESAWRWYAEHVGGGECPVVDTWWQTETGGMMITTLPGVDPMKPGAVGRPLPGIEAEIVDARGDPVEPGTPGHLRITKPWPGIPHGFCDESERVVGADDEWYYVTGDRAVEADYIQLLGRADDVVNVAGTRIGTKEIESAIVDVEGVAEAAVVGGRRNVEGRTIHAYITPEQNVVGDDQLAATIREAVMASIGELAVPERITFAPALPKTRSGKIMRRHLAAIANGERLGDTSALRNPEVVGELESIVEDR
ncbi:acetate--CoA ligase [Haladaptatus sp. DYSN1]|uniref:acetate--CoA ligase n=1 Tax=unclassified Haladaptatus TaxID=2622732 RepID=UPI002405ABB7|nr:acetate--CoA ligase [Haladaptatus sp. DYSN1]